MNHVNIRHGIVTASVYMVAIGASVAILAWMGETMHCGGWGNFLNLGYAIGATLGLAVSFACGYFYDILLSKFTTRCLDREPDMPLQFAVGISRAKLLTRYWGYTAATTLIAASLLFIFSGETYIETVCLLMSCGFTSLIFSLHYSRQAREIRHDRFWLSL